MPRRKDDVSKLLVKLQNQTSDGPSAQTSKNDRARQRSCNLPELNINTYRNADAWPGTGYALVGNSYDCETNLNYRINQKTRADGIAQTLAQGGIRGMVTVVEAVANNQFDQAISCFERNWLNRLARTMPEAMIGRAYNEKGELIETAFAVWRYYEQAATNAGTAKTAKNLVTAGNRQRNR